MLYQNSDSKMLTSKILARIGLDLLATLKFLLFDSWADSKAVLRADYEFLRNFKANKSIREELKRKVGDQEIQEIYNRSVVLDYFVRGKKLFRNLKF